MFFCSLVLGLSLLSVLHDFHVSSCDENCADKPVFTPSRLVVKYGDPASANCSVCQHDCHNSLFDLEKAVGYSTKNNTDIYWTVDSLTEWGLSLQCYYTNATNYQCCTYLRPTLYRPPDLVNISFYKHNGPVRVGKQYSILCQIPDVAPAENVTVSLYIGDRLIDQKGNFPAKTVPDTLRALFTIFPEMKDDGKDYWCAAELQLEGLQPPPMAKSQKLKSVVHYKPQLMGSTTDESITLTSGDELQLNCSAVGNPSPKYNWTLPSQRHDPDGPSIYTIKSVTTEHGGEYICVVSNDYGTTSKKFSVDVRGNYAIIIIVVIIIFILIIAVSAAVIHNRHHKHKKTGNYNVNGDRSHSRQSHMLVPTGDTKDV